MVLVTHSCIYQNLLNKTFYQHVFLWNSCSFSLTDGTVCRFTSPPLSCWQLRATLVLPLAWYLDHFALLLNIISSSLIIHLSLISLAASLALSYFFTPSFQWICILVYTVWKHMPLHFSTSFMSWYYLSFWIVLVG